MSMWNTNWLRNPVFSWHDKPPKTENMSNEKNSRNFIRDCRLIGHGTESEMNKIMKLSGVILIKIEEMKQQ